MPSIDRKTSGNGTVKRTQAKGEAVSEKELEETERKQRISRINHLADRVVDRLGSAIEELESTDTQKIRHVVSALKEIKDLQSLAVGDEAAERELKLRELRRKVESAESESAPKTQTVEVEFRGDDGYTV